MSSSSVDSTPVSTPKEFEAVRRAHVRNASQARESRRMAAEAMVDLNSVDIDSLHNGAVELPDSALSPEQLIVRKRQEWNTIVKKLYHLRHPIPSCGPDVLVDFVQKFLRWLKGSFVFARYRLKIYYKKLKTIRSFIITVKQTRDAKLDIALQWWEEWEIAEKSRVRTMLSRSTARYALARNVMSSYQKLFISREMKVDAIKAVYHEQRKKHLKRGRKFRSRLVELNKAKQAARRKLLEISSLPSYSRYTGDVDEARDKLYASTIAYTEWLKDEPRFEFPSKTLDFVFMAARAQAIAARKNAKQGRGNILEKYIANQAQFRKMKARRKKDKLAWELSRQRKEEEESSRGSPTTEGDLAAVASEAFEEGEEKEPHGHETVEQDDPVGFTRHPEPKPETPLTTDAALTKSKSKKDVSWLDTYIRPSPIRPEGKKSSPNAVTQEEPHPEDISECSMSNASLVKLMRSLKETEPTSAPSKANAAERRAALTEAGGAGFMAGTSSSSEKSRTQADTFYSLENITDKAISLIKSRARSSCIGTSLGNKTVRAKSLQMRDLVKGFQQKVNRKDKVITYSQWSTIKRQLQSAMGRQITEEESKDFMKTIGVNLEETMHRNSLVVDINDISLNAWSVCVSETDPAVTLVSDLVTGIFEASALPEESLYLECLKKTFAGSGLDRSVEFGTLPTIKPSTKFVTAQEENSPVSKLPFITGKPEKKPENRYILP